jgi:hypothetical protein
MMERKESRCFRTHRSLCVDCDGKRRKKGLTCESCHYSSKIRDKNIAQNNILQQQQQQNPAPLATVRQEENSSQPAPMMMTDNQSLVHGSWKDTMLEYLKMEEKRLLAATTAAGDATQNWVQFWLGLSMAGVAELVRVAQPCSSLPDIIEAIPCQLMPPAHKPMPLQPLNMTPSPPLSPTHPYDRSYAGNMPSPELDEAAMRDDWWHSP